MYVQEYTHKHAQIVGLLDDLNADALVLSSAASLSWLLAGARVHVSLAGPPVLRVLVHRQGSEVAAPISESARLLAEEIEESHGIRLHKLDWFASLEDHEAWYPTARELRVVQEAQVEDQLRGLRTVLCESEISRYRQLCANTAKVFTRVLGSAASTDSEQLIAARLSAEAIAFGGEVLVALVCGDARSDFRHPLPTDQPLGRKAMAVLCVRKNGLIANVTRWVRFGDVLPGEVDAEAAILRVEQEIMDSMAPGRELRSVLPVLQKAYPRQGFEASEWQNHHQGGIAGYNGRDPRLTPQVNDVIRANQAFAWNPSAARHGMTFKVEDTVLLSEQDGESTVEVLSFDPQWPSVRVGNLDRPLVLSR